jgi:hypothetical protein
MTRISPESILSRIPVSNVMKIILPVAYRMPGNVVEHTDVQFKVDQTINHFRVTPLCDEVRRRLTGLPTSFSFEVIKGKAVTRNKSLFDLVQDIIKKLLDTKQLLLP